MKKNWLIILLAAALATVSARLAYEHNSAAAGDDSTEASASADALECIMTRYSLRSYSPQKVNDSITEKILRAGMAAPTAVNKQPWEMVVITDWELKDSLANLSRGTSMMKDAPLIISVCANTNRFLKGDTPQGGYWVQDCSAATENMLLAAHALGLGGVWCGVFPVQERVERVRALLNLPDTLIPLNVIAFGYPAGPGSVKEKWAPGRVHYNRFK